MVGIYGLTANAVAQKTHEVGIRRAVGATDDAIIKMFLKQGARQLVIGLGLATACIFCPNCLWFSPVYRAFISSLHVFWCSTDSGSRTFNYCTQLLSGHQQEQRSRWSRVQRFDTNSAIIAQKSLF